MSNEEFFKPLKNKPLLDAQPEETASLDDWRHWALRLGQHVEKLDKIEKDRRKKLRELKRELDHKNKVLGSYKSKVKELEEGENNSEFSLIAYLRSFFRNSKD